MEIKLFTEFSLVQDRLIDVMEYKLHSKALRSSDKDYTTRHVIARIKPGTLNTKKSKHVTHMDIIRLGSDY